MVHSMPVRPDDLGVVGYMEKADNFISVIPLMSSALSEYCGHKPCCVEYHVREEGFR